MKITEVVVKLSGPDDPGRPRLLAYVSVTFDGVFVTHDLKIIGGRDGLFVAMPNKPAPTRCACGRKGTMLDRVCPACGAAVEQPEYGKRFLDIAHPICREFRGELERAVLDEYRRLAGDGQEAGFGAGLAPP